MSVPTVTHRRALWLAALTFVVVSSARGQQPVPSTPGDARPTVAVLPFTNGAVVGNTDYAPLSKGMAEMMITELARNSGVRVVERDRVQHLLDEQNLGSGDRVDKATAIHLGRILGAHHLLMGSFVIDPKQNLRIDVRSVNTETSQIEYVETIEGRADRMLGMVGDLGTRLNAGLKLPQLSARVPTVVPTNAPASTNQFRAMMLMSRALEQQDRGNLDGAISLYRSALDVDPGLDRARVLLASLETSAGRSRAPNR